MPTLKNFPEVTVSEHSIRQLAELSDVELDILAEQFYAIKNATFNQFIESVRSGRIIINAEELKLRVPEGYSISEEG